MEVQECFPDQLKEEPLTEDDIYLTYFNHTAPNPSHIVEAVQIQVASPSAPRLASQPSKLFKAISGDVRNDAKGILP